MKLKDLTMSQWMILCARTACEECTLNETYPEQLMTPFDCVLGMPRLRVAAPWKRTRKHDHYVHRDKATGKYYYVGDLDIPEPWEQMLQDERKLMESLLEVKPCG